MWVEVMPAGWGNEGTAGARVTPLTVARVIEQRRTANTPGRR